MHICDVCKNEVTPGNPYCTACGKPVTPPAVAVISESQPRTNDDRSFSWKTIGRVASIVALIGFTMPWVSCAGNVSSGIDVANRNEFVWFFPISVIAALIMLFTKPASLAQMKKIYGWVAGCGLVSTLIVVIFFLEVLWQLVQMDSEMRQFVGIHVGMDFSLLGASVLLASGVLAYRSVRVEVPKKEVAFHANASASLLPK